MKKNDLISRISSVLMMAWAVSAICIFIYFPGRVSHLQRITIFDSTHSFFEKFYKIDLGKYLFDLLYSLTGVLLFSSVCILLGIYITKKWGIKNGVELSSGLDYAALIATEFLLGHSLLSLVFLFLASWDKLTLFTILSVSVLCSGLGLLEIRKCHWKHPNIFVSINNKNILVWLSIIILALTLLQASSRISYDSTAIYFSDAKLTAMNQGVRFFTGDTFEVSVFQTAIQYSVILDLFGDQSARMFSWICGIVFVLLSFALANKVGLSKLAGSIFLALLSTTTALTDLMGDGKVDLISSLPAIACIYWMVVENKQKEQSKSLLLLVGFLTGLACVARPFNTFLLGIFIIIYYSHQFIFQKKFSFLNYKLLIQTLLWIGLGTIGMGVYHLLANWIILKNPIAFISSISNINPKNGPWDFKPTQILVFRLLYPLVVTFKNSPQSLGNISPLYIAFMPMLLSANIRKRIQYSSETIQITTAAFITLISWIFLFFTITEIRYVMFLWVILFIPFAEIIEATLNVGNLLFRATGEILIIILLIFIVVRSMYISVVSYSQIDQNGNPQCFDIASCNYLKPINLTALPGDRILTFGADRYYLRSDLFACSTTNVEYQVLKELTYKNIEAFWEEVYREGYKYIAYENEYATHHLQLGATPNPGHTPNWIKLERIYGKIGDPYIAYAIHITTPPIQVEKTCQKSSSGIWKVQSLVP